MKGSKHNKNFIYTAILAFAFVLVFTMSFGAILSMPMDKSGVMSDCPFMNENTAICPMNVTEHIGYWQQLFASTIPASSATILLFIFVIAISEVFSKELLNNIIQRFQYLRSHRERSMLPKLFNPILLLISRGILNPKIYSLSR